MFVNEFMEEQPIVVQVLKNAVEKNKCSHAYLFETNGYEKKDAFVLSFAKYLLCPNQQKDPSLCHHCSRCEQIEKGIFSDYMVIEPDGMWIKKEQLEDLQKKFSTKSVEGTTRLYVIKHAEKLNSSSANSILKFLEEPEANIVAILLTDNLYQMLNTIVSRCQIISFAKTPLLEVDHFIDRLKGVLSVQLEDCDENLFDETLLKSLSFVEFYEQNGIDTLLHTQKLFHHYFKDRNQIIAAFDLMILYYKDMINQKVHLPMLLMELKEEEINKIISHNTVEQLSQKLKILLELKEEIKVNVNNNLLLDRLIIKWEGVRT